MLAKKKCVHEKQILGELLPVMESAVYGREAAEQVLEKLCGLLGGETDCIVSAAVKGKERFLFTTLPEDEARYYQNIAEEKPPAERISGKKALRIKLEAKGGLEGVWVFEVPEHVPEEEISAYQNIASVIKFFLYSCLFAQECERQAHMDCFTGLPACRLFEQDIYKRLSGREQGFLIVVRGPAEVPKPYREDGVNFFLIKMAGVCISTHPDGVYRTGHAGGFMQGRERGSIFCFTGIYADASGRRVFPGTIVWAGCGQRLYQDSERHRYRRQGKFHFRWQGGVPPAACFSGGNMRKGQKVQIILSGLMGLLLAVGISLYPSCTACAEEVPQETGEATIYDSLKERMETAWDQGMDRLEDAEPVEITGNLVERILRGIAAALFRNLRSIKAGALLVGVVSFVLGGATALLARRDKKIQKKAIGICMAAIPGLLTVLVFGISWFVSIFR